MVMMIMMTVVVVVVCQAFAYVQAVQERMNMSSRKANLVIDAIVRSITFLLPSVSVNYISVIVAVSMY